MKRWEVIARDVSGREIDRDTFFFHWSARRYKAFQDATASGDHPWLSALPAGMPPLWTSELLRRSGKIYREETQ